LNRTPLHYAAALSDELAEILKEKGADANAKDAKQHTPAFYKEEKVAILSLRDALNLPTSTDPDNKADDDNQSTEDKKQEDDDKPARDSQSAEDNQQNDDTNTEQTSAAE